VAYATLAELRALPDMADTTTYSDALLTQGLAYAVELVEGYCGAKFAPGPFSGAATNWGPYAASLRVLDVVGVQSITAATDHKGAAIDVTSWTVDYDRQLVWSPVPVYDTDIRVSGTACATPSGVPQQINWAIRTIATQYAKDLWSRIPDRALSIANDFGMTPLAQAGGNSRPTNLPDVNAVLVRYRLGSPIAS
jgi:hypothetical protein